MRRLSTFQSKSTSSLNVNQAVNEVYFQDCASQERWVTELLKWKDNTKELADKINIYNTKIKSLLQSKNDVEVLIHRDYHSGNDLDTVKSIETADLEAFLEEFKGLEEALNNINEKKKHFLHYDEKLKKIEVASREAKDEKRKVRNELKREDTRRQYADAYKSMSKKIDYLASKINHFDKRIMNSYIDSKKYLSQKFDDYSSSLPSMPIWEGKTKLLRCNCSLKGNKETGELGFKAFDFVLVYRPPVNGKYEGKLVGSNSSGFFPSFCVLEVVSDGCWLNDEASNKVVALISKTSLNNFELSFNQGDVFMLKYKEKETNMFIVEDKAKGILGYVNPSYFQYVENNKSLNFNNENLLEKNRRSMGRSLIDVLRDQETKSEGNKTNITVKEENENVGSETKPIRKKSFRKRNMSLCLDNSNFTDIKDSQNNKRKTSLTKKKSCPNLNYSKNNLISPTNFSNNLTSPILSKKTSFNKKAMTVITNVDPASTSSNSENAPSSPPPPPPPLILVSVPLPSSKTNHERLV